MASVFVTAQYILSNYGIVHKKCEVYNDEESARIKRKYREIARFRLESHKKRIYNEWFYEVMYYDPRLLFSSKKFLETEITEEMIDYFSAASDVNHDIECFTKFQKMLLEKSLSSFIFALREANDSLNYLLELSNDDQVEIFKLKCMCDTLPPDTKIKLSVNHPFLLHLINKN